MKHTKLKSLFAPTLMTAMISSLPLFAEEAVRVNWDRVCEVAEGRQLMVTTSNGDTVQGYCASIDVDGIRVTTKDHGVIRIARKTLTKLEMERSKGNQLRKLGKHVHEALRYGYSSLLSPAAPVGLVVLPATLAWGAFATPFCVLGDLRARIEGTQEIKPL